VDRAAPAVVEDGSIKRNVTTKDSGKTIREESEQSSIKDHGADEKWEKEKEASVNRNSAKSAFSDGINSSRKDTYVALDEGESVVESGKKKKNKTRTRRSAKVRDWTRDIAHQDLDAERVQEGSSDYANEDDSHVELGIPQMLMQGGTRQDDKSKLTKIQQESSNSIKSKVSGNRDLVGANQGPNANSVATPGSQISGAISFDKKLQQE
jgi:hypothetical protein